jgi:hypothetical protein
MIFKFRPWTPKDFLKTRTLTSNLICNMQTYYATCKPTMQHANLLCNMQIYFAICKPTMTQSKLLCNKQTYYATSKPTLPNVSIMKPSRDLWIRNTSWKQELWQVSQLWNPLEIFELEILLENKNFYKCLNYETHGGFYNSGRLLENKNFDKCLKLWNPLEVLELRETSWKWELWQMSQIMKPSRDVWIINTSWKQELWQMSQLWNPLEIL